MLDVLRILLCVGVTFYHYTPIRPASGSFSVLVFLVMSGFLLGLHFDLVRFVSRYNSPLWFMVVEFCMLLAAPFFFVLYKRRFIIVFLVACALVSWFLYQQIPYASNRGCGLYYSPLARCWQFIAGMAAAWLYCRICTVKRGK